METPDGGPGRRTEAAVRSTWWPGWIWAIPVAAVAIVVWLVVRAVSDHGTSVTVVFEQAAGMTAQNTPVMYRGVSVGQVTGIAIAPDARHVIADVSIDESMKHSLNAETHFYLVGAHPSLSDPSSLKAILAGPSLEMRPGPGKPVRQFVGIEGKPPDAIADAVPYLAQFDGPVGGLQVGAPVTLRGFTVGDVTQVLLTYDANTGTIATPVILALDPSRFHIHGRSPSGDGDWAPVMHGVMRTLVQEGLRARLTQTPPLIGSPEVTLEIVPGARHATLATDGVYPEIPTVSGGGLSGFMTALGTVPIGDIGDDLRAITGHVRTLVSSPQLKASIDHLDHTLASLDTTVHMAGAEVTPMIKSLNQTAGELDATVKSAQMMVGGSVASPNGNLQQTLHELTEAARALRSLADYLDQHPEALIKGRSQ